MQLIMQIKKESKWTFDTSATGGVGIGIVAGTGGLVRLKNPSGSPISFHYGSIGVGFGIGLKLPKIPKIPKIDLKGKSGSGSTTDLPSYGIVYMTEAFNGTELGVDDFKGPCMSIDGGGGLIAGASGTVLLLGIDPVKFALLSLPALTGLMFTLCMASAKAVVLMGGVNVGIQAGAGVSCTVGYLR